MGSRKTHANHRFWYDQAFPHVEARWVHDGRGVCYAPHSHSTLSVGLITGGTALYLNGKTESLIGPGTTVIMNPGVIHACNPQGDTPWSYMMLYFDPQWITAIAHDIPLSQAADLPFRPFASTESNDPILQAALRRVLATLTATDPAHTPDRDGLFYETAAILLDRLAPQADHPRHPCDRQAVRRAEAIMEAHWDEKLTLDDLCDAVGLSPSHLIRSFKAVHGFTPHAYLNNLRINRAKGLLRQGMPLAETAVASGFVDQAHFHRVFKRLTASTPGTYVGQG